MPFPFCSDNVGGQTVEVRALAGVLMPRRIANELTKRCSVFCIYSRIVAPDAVVDLTKGDDTTQLVKNMHDHTYGM